MSASRRCSRPRSAHSDESGHWFRRKAEKIAEQVIRIGRQGDGKQELRVDIKQLVEEQRLITGVHEVYGEMYRLLGLDELLQRSRYRASHDALFHVVMARIANPDSKRGSVRRLEEDFGVSLPLEKVYRMMDRMDAKAIERLRTRVGEASRSLLPEPAAVLFFDCTTLAFETAVEDELRQHGFSKDGKHRDSQVLLALMVSREGLPISYEVLPGATCEGHSLVPVLHAMQQRHQVERTVCVADRGMLSADNLDAMDAMGNDYVVGARLRQLPAGLREQILENDAYGPLQGSPSRRVGEWQHQGRRLIVIWCPERARKDAHDRRKTVERLLDKLSRSSNPKELLSNQGAKRFIVVTGGARLTVDPEKIAEAERWDGLAGVITNLRDATVAEVLSHYHGLWQVEESFRITKHDLRVRPIWHWTPDRIRAHIAIAFMAFACVRHLAYRVAIQTMSEFELQGIKARLLGGQRNAAARGALKMRLPVGLAYNGKDEVVFDPDRSVVDAIRLVFDSFRRMGSAMAVVKWMHRENIELPSRPRGGPANGELRWALPHAAQIARILGNPRYAGAFVYGRTRIERRADGTGRCRAVPMENWQVCIPDAHASFIDWDEFLRNRDLMASNARAFLPSPSRTAAPREGAALLQSRVICGHCGQRMSMRYTRALPHRNQTARYFYTCSEQLLRYGRKICQSMRGDLVDAEISRFVIDALNRKNIDLALAVQEQVKVEFAEADARRAGRIEAIRYEADLARRRFFEIDPGNRLVAASLEADWNERLRDLEEACREREARAAARYTELSAQQAERIRELARDFEQIWNAAQTGNADRKRLLGFLIEDATLTRDGLEVTIGLRMRGGRSLTLEPLQLQRSMAQIRKQDTPGNGRRTGPAARNSW